MSTDRQAASPQRQRELYREYVTRWGLVDCGEYSDEATSATDNPPDKRPGFLGCVAAARRREFDLVWVEERSRLARRPEDYFGARAALGAYRVAIVTLADDPGQERHTAIAEFTEGLFALLDRYKVGQMGEQLSRAQAVLVKQGNYRGGSLPAGLAWQWDDREARRGHYVLHEPTAPLAVRAFELFAASGCYATTARTLDAEGYLSRQGRRIGLSALHKLLTCSVYRGARRWGNELYPTALPEIVPPALVATVDAILEQQRLRPQRATQGTASRALFCGLLRCPECGAWLSVSCTTPRPSGKVYLSYHCRHSRGAPITCTWRKFVPELAFEAAIMPAIVRAVQQERLGRPPARRRDRTHARRLESLQGERGRVLLSYHRGRIGEDECDRLLADVDARLAALAAPEDVREVPVSVEDLRALQRALGSAWPELETSARRAILQTLVESITPEPGDWANSAIAWRRLLPE